MPFSKVIESPIIASGAEDEVFKRLTMDFRITSEGVMRSRESIKRKVYHPEFSWHISLRRHASSFSVARPRVMPAEWPSRYQVPVRSASASGVMRDKTKSRASAVRSTAARPAMIATSKSVGREG